MRNDTRPEEAASAMARSTRRPSAMGVIVSWAGFYAVLVLIHNWSL